MTGRAMTREEALDAAVEALEYVLDNDTDYLAGPVVAQWSEAYRVLNENTCEGCADCEFPGVRWPTETNMDNTHQWVERCDLCQRHESDEAAAEVVRKVYPDADTGEAVAAGTINPTPYVDKE